MTEYKIEPDVPMPPGRGNAIYPLAEMKVGDSFSFTQDKLRAVRAASVNYGKRNAGVKFATRRVGTEVWRCWRTA